MRQRGAEVGGHSLADIGEGGTQAEVDSAAVGCVREQRDILAAVIGAGDAGIASMVGGQYGEGTLLKKGAAVAYYKTTGASVGLQAGGQTYGYAMFFMNAKAVEQLDNANGFEVGVGPSIVVVDEGMAKTTTTKTLKEDIYAFVFGQKGLMAGIGIQGNKITKINPK